MCLMCCWHKTGRIAKEVAKKHGTFEAEFYKCVEVECCKCGKKQWEHRVLLNAHTGKQSFFTASAVADLPLLSQVKEGD